MALALALTTITGTAVQVTATFTTPGGEAVDPTTVEFQYRGGAATGEGSLPAIVTLTYGTDDEITNPTTGTFVCTFTTATKPGRWTVQVVGTGTCAVVGAIAFRVVERPLRTTTEDTTPTTTPKT